MIGRLVIRADADGAMGTGHVMRCLALAQEWRRQGGEVVFLGRIGSEYLRRRLIAEGCCLHFLAAVHPDSADLMEVGGWLEERKAKAGWLVLDGYHFDTAYHDAIRASGWQLLVIDDYGHLPEYHAEILLNPNAYAGDLAYRTQPDTLRLLGPRYAPLRSEFQEVSRKNREVAGCGRRVLITMGGADPDNVSGRVADALLALDRADLAVKIVVGPLNPHRADLNARLAGAPFMVELLDPVSEMAPLMQWADLAISAAGSTCWELAAMGVPMLVTVLADNQERLAASLEGNGAAINSGWFHSLRPEHLATVIDDLLASQERRRHMAELGQKLVDGLGSGRVIDNLFEKKTRIFLRLVSDSDCRVLWDWVNDPEVRSVSFLSKPIDWQEHQQWFFAKRKDGNCIHFIAVNEQDVPIGQVRFDIDQDEAEIDISVDRNARKAGYGKRMILCALENICMRKNINIFHAYVKRDNEKSIKLFTQAGFCDAGIILRQGYDAVHFIKKQQGACAHTREKRA